MQMEPGKVFIGGISWDTDEDRLREYFCNYGDVIEAVIMKDRNTGRARGFGFVVFADPAVAERVVREKHIIDGRTVSHLCIFIWKFRLCSIKYTSVGFTRMKLEGDSHYLGAHFNVMFSKTMHNIHYTWNLLGGQRSVPS